MEILDGRAISETIFRRYSRNPNGWSYTIFPSNSNGFYDAVIASADESWQLKIDTIFKPSPLVLGSKSEADFKQHPSLVPLSFGYREMTASVVKDLGTQEQGDPGLVELLRGLSPVVPEAGKSYAHGPFVLAKGARRFHDQAQARTDERLSSEMLRLVRNRYPGYG